MFDWLTVAKLKNIAWHCFIGLSVAWLGFLIFWLVGAGIWASWIGFIAGSCVGIGVEGYQIVWIKWGQPVSEWLLMSVTDILEYMLFASTTLILLFI